MMKSYNRFGKKMMKSYNDGMPTVAHA